MKLTEKLAEIKKATEIEQDNLTESNKDKKNKEMLMGIAFGTGLGSLFYTTTGDITALALALFFGISVGMIFNRRKIKTNH